MNEQEQLDLSIIICSKNSYDDLVYHFSNIKNFYVKEFIFVCGTDDEYNFIKYSYEQTNKYTKVIVLKDNNLGIGDARRIGMEEANGDYILYLGPDNRVSPDNVKQIYKELQYNETFKALAFSQRINNPKNYLEKLQNFRFEYKFPTYMPLEVIGTPHIIKTSLAKEVGYDSSAGPCDDTVFFKEFTRIGHKIAFSDAIAIEEPQNIFKRMLWYSHSDFNYLKYLDEVKMRNYIHAFKTEFFYIFKEKNLFRLTYFLPGALMLSSVRFLSFLRLVLCSRENKSS